MSKSVDLKQNIHRRKIHVGLRTIKTVIAVFFSAMIGVLRGQPTFFSMINAVICMQNSREKTITTAANRVLGTLIGGAFGIAFVYLSMVTGLTEHLLFYYLFEAICLIPVIMVTLLIKMDTISAYSCVVFISATVNHGFDGTVITYALNRILDTFIGIVIAFAINMLIPNHRQRSESKPAGEETYTTCPAEEAQDGGGEDKMSEESITERADTNG